MAELVKDQMLEDEVDINHLLVWIEKKKSKVGKTRHALPFFPIVFLCLLYVNVA